MGCRPHRSMFFRPPPCLSITHPEGLVALTGYLKRLSSDGDSKAPVYCRGECRRHSSLIPSLFRGSTSDEEVDKRVQAEEHLERKVRDTFSGMKRFSERHITAILQHYGVRTSWIDLVDNLYIAVWFALHDRRQVAEDSFSYAKSKSSTGWIHFVSTVGSHLPSLQPRDLRSEHLSLSLRPHAQHGISISRRSRKHWNSGNIDLQSYVVASAEISNDTRFWHLAGYMLDPSFLFPGPDDDDTYKVLLGNKMQRLIQETERSYSLALGSLGKIDRYSH